MPILVLIPIPEYSPNVRSIFKKLFIVELLLQLIVIVPIKPLILTPSKWNEVLLRLYREM